MAGARSSVPPERRGGLTDAVSQLVLGLIVAVAGLLLMRRGSPGDLPVWVCVVFLVVPGGAWALVSAVRLAAAVYRTRTASSAVEDRAPVPPGCPDGSGGVRG